MKIVTANGKQNLRMSKSEWAKIGRRNGWLKSADSEHWYGVVQKRANEILNTIREDIAKLLVAEPGLSADEVVGKIHRGTFDFGRSKDLQETVKSLIALQNSSEGLLSRVEERNAALVEALIRGFGELIQVYRSQSSS